MIHWRDWRDSWLCRRRDSPGRWLWRLVRPFFEGEKRRAQSGQKLINVSFRSRPDYPNVATAFFGASHDGVIARLDPRHREEVYGEQDQRNCPNEREKMNLFRRVILHRREQNAEHGGSIAAVGRRRHRFKRRRDLGERSFEGVPAEIPTLITPERAVCNFEPQRAPKNCLAM